MMRVFITIVALALALGLFVYLTTQPRQSPHTTSEGQVVSVKGQLFGRKNLETSARELKANAPLPSPYILTTVQNSGATIEFGERLRLGAETRLKVEKLGSRYRFHLQQGELKRLKPVERSEFIVGKELAPPEQIHLSFFSHNNSPAIQTTEASKKSGDDDSTDTEAPQLLRDTLTLHQRFLEKCFIQHLDRKHGQSQSGEVKLYLRIEKNGRFSEVEVRDTPYQDEKFHDCLVEVMQRVRLKKEGLQARSLEYPLIFKLP